MSRVVMTVENLLVPRLSSLIEARWTIGLTRTVGALTNGCLSYTHTVHGTFDKAGAMARAVYSGHSESDDLPRTVRIVI